jgi:hypothetical protein
MIEYLGFWEKINNPKFNLVEFDPFKNETGSKSFALSPHKWIETTGAIGLISKAGRYGGGILKRLCPRLVGVGYERFHSILII